MDNSYCLLVKEEVEFNIITKEINALSMAIVKAMDMWTIIQRNKLL